MKVLFLGKRSPQQRDLHSRPYGRFFHLPRRLAATGHEVQLCLLGHRGEADVEQVRDGMRWHGRNLSVLSARRGLRDLAARAHSFRPDWVVGVSDAWTSVLAARLARRCGARLALDAYDDYEAYMAWNLPLHALYRRSLRAADLVTAAGPQLAERLGHHRGRADVRILPMAADPAFIPMDRAGCRKALGLPATAPLLGYYGGWGKARGTQLLLPAFRRIREQVPDALLVVTGRPPAGVVANPGVLATGPLADAQLPAFVNAIDVCAVVTADTRFGRGSYPVKLCEAMACGTAVVATDTAPVRWMLGNRSEGLVPVGDPRAFADRVLQMLPAGRTDYGPQPDWNTLGDRFAAWLAETSAA